MYEKLMSQYFKPGKWGYSSGTEKTVDKSYTPRYNEDSKTTSYDLDDVWKSEHEKELRYAGDSARESVDKGLKETSKFMKGAPEGTNYSDVQSASVKWSLAGDTNNKELQQSAFDELTGLLSTVNKEQYLKKARPLQEFVDAKDTFDYNRKNYTTTKNAKQGYSVTTYDLQQLLNKEGYTDKFGNSLKEDGIMGAKTQYAHDQMLEAENAKKSASTSAEQPTAQVKAVEPTRPSETTNPLKDALARYHESDIASRGGTRGRSTANNTPNTGEYNKRLEENAKLNGKSVAKIEKSSDVISRNADAIKAAGKKYGVNPSIIASCIYTEQVLNVNFRDTLTDEIAYFMDTSIGIGQVKVSTARLMEDKGYIKGVEYMGRKEIWHGNGSVLVNYWNVPGYGIVEGSREKAIAKRLTVDEQCIEYVAAYLKYWQDEWKDEYPIIDGKSDVLGTLFNLGDRANAPNPNPKTIPFGDKVKDNYHYMQYLLGIE